MARKSSWIKTVIFTAILVSYVLPVSAAPKRKISQAPEIHQINELDKLECSTLGAKIVDAQNVEHPLKRYLPKTQNQQTCNKKMNEWFHFMCGLFVGFKAQKEAPVAPPQEYQLSGQVLYNNGKDTQYAVLSGNCSAPRIQWRDK